MGYRPHARSLGQNPAHSLLRPPQFHPLGRLPQTNAEAVDFGVGVPDAHARYVADTFRSVREDRFAQVTGDVETLTGRPPRELEPYAKDYAAALAA